MKFQNVLLASDFDDTLVNRKKQLPERTKAALHYFVENGGYFTVASGRGVDAMRLQIGSLPVNAPVICANGTQIYDFRQEKLLHLSYLPPEAKEDFRKVLAAFPGSAVEIFSQGTVYCVNSNPITVEHLKLIGAEGVDAELDEIPEGWIYAKFEEDTPVLAQMQTYIRDNFPGRYEAIFSHKYLLEVADASDGKGNGVLRVADILGVDRKDIYCAGDNENDVSMLKVAQIGFVPEHSTPIALAHADRVVCDCDEGSIADIIEILDQIYS